MPGRILIADDVTTNRIVLKVKLSQAFYDVSQAASGAETIAIARETSPDLILVDLNMSDMSGIEICASLKSHPETSGIPIIVVTSVNDHDAKIGALEAGADDFMVKPLDEATLLARARSLLRARATDLELMRRDSTCREYGFAESRTEFDTPANIAMISAAPETARRWKNALASHSASTVQIMTKESALQPPSIQTVPDLYVIEGDLDRPNEGLRLLSEIRSRAETRHAAVIMVLNPPLHEQAVTALDLGANDLMQSGFQACELILRAKTQVCRKRQADRLRTSVEDGLRMALIDPLTGLYNRRYAEPQLAQIARRADVTGRRFAVMMVDLDRFKTVNDTYGHAAGDEVLIETARRIRSALRGADLVARMGGEEFMIAMPDTDQADAQAAAERIRVAINEMPFHTKRGGPIHITTSIGLTMNSHRDVQALLEVADNALYHAKARGRNQVTIAA